MKLSQYLSEKIFTKDIEQKANRDGFGDGLKEAGEKNSAVMALTADLAESTRVNLFAEAFPERFVECGVAEQNMASLASGLSAMGKIPFIASYAMFSPGRSWEQVRTTIAYNNANVKIIGAHAGVSVGPDGATHQAIEDIALMRVIPGMVVLAPADSVEARKATLWAAEHKGPVYIRLARSATAVVFRPETPYHFGEAKILMEPDSNDGAVAILSTGTLLYEALEAGKALNESGVNTTVVHFGSVKPLDTSMLERLVKTHDRLVTVEEHQRAGGFGGAVAEWLSEHRPKSLLRLGVDDQFGESGEPAELLKHFGLDSDSIARQVKDFINF